MPPTARDLAGVPYRSIVTLLIRLLGARDELEEAFEWLARGRAAETSETRLAAAPHWDMNEVRLRAQRDEPGSWVAELAVVLERYRENQAAVGQIANHLIEMGLVRPVANPDNPRDIMLDSRILQLMLAEYGPRVTTASGRLGVSATRGEIWTPGSDAGGSGTSSGGLWTPGGAATSAGTGEKPKLIIPGR